MRFEREKNPDGPLVNGFVRGGFRVDENVYRALLLTANRADGWTPPPLDALDKAVHRFLVAGFPLLTLGIVTGTVWAQNLESGTADEIMRVVFGYTTWLLFAAVLLLRAMAGWRGRRAAYGTIAGLGCAAAVAIIYLVRPAVVVASATIGG